MSKWTKVDDDLWTAHDGRFTITAKRTQGGYIRRWVVVDNGTQTSPDSLGSGHNRAAVREWIAGRVAATLTPNPT